MPFNDLLLSTSLSQIGLHLSRTRASLSPFYISLSSQQARTHVFGLLLQAHAPVSHVLFSIPLSPQQAHGRVFDLLLQARGRVLDLPLQILF